MNVPFKKMCLILWLSLLENMTFKRMVSRLQVIAFLKLIKFIKLLYIYREMGLSESALKSQLFQSHCKVSCNSPCCVKICGEGNHCNINIGTHENVISDSDEEHIETK